MGKMIYKGVIGLDSAASIFDLDLKNYALIVSTIRYLLKYFILASFGGALNTGPHAYKKLIFCYWVISTNFS